MKDKTPEPEGEIIVCEGPPNCMLTGDEALENQIAGCPLCKRTLVFDDGSEQEYKIKTH